MDVERSYIKQYIPYLERNKVLCLKKLFGSRYWLLLLLFSCWNTTSGKKRLKKLDLRQGIKDAQGSSSVTHFYTLHHLPGKEESFSFLLMLSWFKGSKWMTDHTSFFPLPSSSSSSLGLRRWRWEEKSDHRYRDIISSSLLYTCLGNIFGLMTKRIRSYRHWDDGRECHSSRKNRRGTMIKEWRSVTSKTSKVNGIKEKKRGWYEDVSCANKILLLLQETKSKPKGILKKNPLSRLRLLLLLLNDLYSHLKRETCLSCYRYIFPSSPLDC